MVGTSGIWNFRTETKKITEANFPIDLPKLCVNLLSYKNDIVLDPFAGGGTTLVAAKQLERRYIGFEISNNYCNIANKRLKNAVLPLKTFMKKKRLY